MMYPACTANGSGVHVLCETWSRTSWETFCGCRIRSLSRYRNRWRYSSLQSSPRGPKAHLEKGQKAYNLSIYSDKSCATMIRSQQLWAW
jgi:hypothetical protein